MWWRSVEVGAPTGDVWALLVDVDHWPAWGPTVTRARLDHPGTRIAAGRTGAVRTPVGLWMPFEITGYDDAARTWSSRAPRRAAVGCGSACRGGRPPTSPSSRSLCAGCGRWRRRHRTVRIGDAVLAALEPSLTKLLPTLERLAETTPGLRVRRPRRRQGGDHPSRCRGHPAPRCARRGVPHRGRERRRSAGLSPR